MGQLPVYLLSTAYISLNRFRGKRENENLAALNAVFVDLDYHATSTWRAKAPEVVQAAYADDLDANGLTQPSIFMQSGRGLYAIWLIRELPPAARQRWRAAQRALIDFSASFGADRACSDEARVFRIPGSTNEKNGKTVSISGGSLQRHGFDALEDQIYRACGRPVRAELQARRAKRAQRTCRTGTPMPRGLTQKQRHEIILDDLEIYRLYLGGGQIPEGQRNLFLHIYATCLTHILDARDIEEEVTDMANRAVPDMKQADVRIIVKQAMNKAGRPMSTCVWKDDRYAYASALEDVFTAMLASDGQPNPKARDAVRDLIAEIVVSPAEKDGVPVEVRGRLTALISNRSKNLGGLVVAEEGLEVR